MTSRRLSIASAFLPGDDTTTRSAPEWLKDAIDAVFVAGVLLTLALVAL